MPGGFPLQHANSRRSIFQGGAAPAPLSFAGGLIIKTVNVSAAEFSALDTVPKRILLAPALTQIIVPVSVTMYVNMTAGNFGANPGLKVQYDSAAWDGINYPFTALPFQPGVIAQKFTVQLTSSLFIATTGAVWPAGQGLYLRGTASMAGGTATAKFTVAYYVVDL